MSQNIEQIPTLTKTALFTRRIGMVVGFLVCLIFIGPDTCQGSLRDTLIQARYLQGIDTIVTHAAYGPRANILLSNLLVSTTNDFNYWVQASVRREFPSASKIVVGCWVCQGPAKISFDETKTPNVMHLWFRLSARKEMINGSPVITGALAVQFRQSDYFKEPVDFSPWAATYPFIVPATRKELQQTVEDGVRYLTDFLPYEMCGLSPADSPCPPSAGYKTYSEQLPWAISVKEPDIRTIQQKVTP